MKHIKNILLAGVLIMATFFVTRNFFPGKETSVKTKTEWDTLYQDTGSVKWVKSDPKIIYRDTGSTDTIILPPDSAEITRKYLQLHAKHYTLNAYNDTLQNDTSALIVVRDTVQQNKIQGRSYKYMNRTPTLVKTTTNIYDQARWYLGVKAGAHSIEPTAMVHTTKDFNFSVGYNIIGHKGIRFGIYYEL